MMPSRLLKAAAALFCLALAACVSTPMPINNPPLDYNAQRILQLDVAEVLVLNDASTAPLTAELAGKYGPSPEDALREWAGRRIQPTGTQGTYSVIIKDANFAATQLPVESGMSGYFKRQQVVRWDAYLNVMIAVEGSAQMLPPAELTVNVRASQSLGEKPSEEEKKQAYNSILNKLMALFNAEAQKQMDTYFRAYYR